MTEDEMASDIGKMSDEEVKANVDRVFGDDLAKRAVKCKAWRWMPGMRSTETTLWCGHSWSDGRQSWEGDTEDALPDLTDPATLGCLLHLVREHWGDLSARIEKVRLRSGGELSLCRAPFSLMQVAGSIEAEALVKALEMEIPND